MVSILGTLDPLTISIIITGFTVQWVYLWATHNRARTFGIILSVSLVTGVVSAFAAGEINGTVLTFHGMMPATEAVFIAPIVEESLKFGFLMIAIHLIRARFGTSFRDTSVRQMGLGTGIVFTFLERIAKDSTANLGLPLTILGEAPLHSVTTGIATLSIQNGVVTRKILLLLPIAILIHAGFNYFLTLPGAEILLYVGFVALWAGFFVIGYVFRTK